MLAVLVLTLVDYCSVCKGLKFYVHACFIPTSQVTPVPVDVHFPSSVLSGCHSVHIVIYSVRSWMVALMLKLTTADARKLQYVNLCQCMSNCFYSMELYMYTRDLLQTTRGKMSRSALIRSSMSDIHFTKISY